MRIQLPKGDRIWGSVWLGPKMESGNIFAQIDMIAIENKKNDFKLRGGLKTGKNYEYHGFEGKLNENVTDEFHEYALEWRKNQMMSWAIDGKVYYNETINKFSEFDGTTTFTIHFIMIIHRQPGSI